MFKLEMETCNASFRDDYDNLDPMATEVCRILWKVKVALENGATSGVLVDECGNTVGSWKYDEEV